MAYYAQEPSNNKQQQQQQPVPKFGLPKSVHEMLDRLAEVIRSKGGSGTIHVELQRSDVESMDLNLHIDRDQLV